MEETQKHTNLYCSGAVVHTVAHSTITGERLLFTSIWASSSSESKHSGGAGACFAAAATVLSVGCCLTLLLLLPLLLLCTPPPAEPPPLVRFFPLPEIFARIFLLPRVQMFKKETFMFHAKQRVTSNQPWLLVFVFFFAPKPKFRAKVTALLLLQRFHELVGKQTTSASSVWNLSQTDD